MSLIQVLLGLCFLGFLFVGIGVFRRSKFLMLLVLSLSVLAIYFIFNPNATTTVAQLIGVNRGADLLLYIFVVSFVFINYFTLIKLRRMKNEITILSQEIAILNEKKNGTHPKS